jgi:hypothetical protein
MLQSCTCGGHFPVGHCSGQEACLAASFETGVEGANAYWLLRSIIANEAVGSSMTYQWSMMGRDPFNEHTIMSIK